MKKPTAIFDRDWEWGELRRFVADPRPGITLGIVFQALINVSVVLGLLPPKGIPLPFISAGGSSLVSTLCAIGIMLNISRQSGESARLEENDWRSFGAIIDLRRGNGRRSIPRPRRSQRANG